MFIYKDKSADIAYLQILEEGGGVTKRQEEDQDKGVNRPDTQRI